MPANTRRSKATDESMPYKYEDLGLELGISELTFDDGESGSPSYEDRTIPLHEYGDWDEVTISANLTVNGSVSRVFPEEEGPPFPAKAIVVIDCEATQCRHRKTVIADPVEVNTEEQVDITLERQLYRDTIRLTPRLVRAEPCRVGLPFAPNPGMRVAGGQGWELEIDESDRNSDGFPFVYRDFSQEGMPPEELAHSFSRNPNPKVMVNDANDGIVDILQSGGTYGFRPNLKAVVKDDFGMLLWIQLILMTGTTIAETDDTEFPWQEGVIQEMTDSVLGTHLFDEDADYDRIEQELGDRVDDPASLREFLPEVTEAVQLYSDYASDLDYFVKEEAP